MHGGGAAARGAGVDGGSHTETRRQLRGSEAGSSYATTCYFSRPLGSLSNPTREYWY